MKNSSVFLLSFLLIILLFPIQNLAQDTPYDVGTVCHYPLSGQA